MLMSATGGIEGIEGLIGRFLPPLKVSESHLTDPSTVNQNAATVAASPTSVNKQHNVNGSLGNGNLVPS